MNGRTDSQSGISVLTRTHMTFAFRFLTKYHHNGLASIGGGKKSLPVPRRAARAGSSSSSVDRLDSSGSSSQGPIAFFPEEAAIFSSFSKGSTRRLDLNTWVWTSFPSLRLLLSAIAAILFPTKSFHACVLSCQVMWPTEELFYSLGCVN